MIAYRGESEHENEFPPITFLRQPVSKKCRTNYQNMKEIDPDRLIRQIVGDDFVRLI
jgi:hypothetical protein